jgi:HTH-like domain
VSRLQFVADHRDAFEVKWLCSVVEIARSSFYAWLAGAEGRAARQAADQALAERIRVVHDDDNTYGAPRITAALNDGALEEERVNRKRVARVMGAAGIAGYRRRRRVKTTQPDPASRKVPDLLKRDFTAPTTNVNYVGDITYLPLATGSNLYLATVIDCCSRRGHWVGDRRSHAHRTRRGCPQRRCRVAGLTGRRGVPLRSRKSVHLKGFRETPRRVAGHSIHRRGGVECGQRVGRIVPRDPQTRSSARP